MHRGPFLFLLLAMGCSGPLVVDDAGSTGEESTSTTEEPPDPVETSTTAGPTPGTTAVTTAVTATTSTGEPVDATGAATEETGDSTGVGGFITDPDGGICGDGFCPASDGIIAHCSYCSYLDQDCARGEVCKPRDFCDAGTWSRSACVPAQPDANGQPGDPCTMEDSPYSGIGSCGPQSMCFDVDPVTLEGTCAAFCSVYGSPDFECESPDQTCFEGNGGWISLCLPRCSPLLGDCPPGQGCYPGSDSDFVCITEDVPLYENTNTLHPSCPPGSFMTSAADACPDETPCCVAYCDLAVPSCDPGFQCVPFFDDLEGIDADYHDVGYCAPA